MFAFRVQFNHLHTYIYAHNRTQVTTQKRDMTLPVHGGAPAIKKRAHIFLNKLMESRLEDLGGGAGVRVIRDIPSLVRDDSTLDIIVREITTPFFEACIAKADEGYRVCATGNPGIGKSYSIPYMIKLILQSRACSVVFDHRELDWYFVFTSQIQSNSDGTTRMVYCADVLSKTDFSKPSALSILYEKANFYLVDPGGVDHANCNPGIQVRAHVMMFPSPNGKYWNKSQFVKRKGEVGKADPSDKGSAGTFLYNSVWSMEELQVSSAIITGKPITDKQIQERVRVFGRIPRHVFATEAERKVLERDQLAAINSLSQQQVADIYNDAVAKIENKSGGQPSSFVMMYRVVKDADGTYDFERPSIEIVSENVRNMIAVRHQEFLWDAMARADSSSTLGMMFEPIVRDRLKTRTNYQVCSMNEKNVMHNEILGGCKAIKFVKDLSQAVKTAEDNTLYHSWNATYPLIDCIYKDGDVYNAFQITVGGSHSCKIDAMTKLVQDLELKLNQRLKIFYAIPAENMTKFTLSPTPTKLQTEIPEMCSVFFLAIVKPVKQSHNQHASAFPATSSTSTTNAAAEGTDTS